MNLRRLVGGSLLGVYLTFPAVARAADEPTIPQDPQRQEQRFRDMLAWNRRTLIGAYEKVGKKDPRWDKPAREALDAAARNFSHTIDPQTYLWDIHNATQTAIGFGCDDPLILYLHARSFHKNVRATAEEIDRCHTAAATGMKNSAYPPFRRAIALSKAGTHAVGAKGAYTEERFNAAERLFETALGLLPLSAAEDERTPDLEHHWLQIALEALQGYRLTGGDDLAAFEKVDAALAKSPALKVVRLQVKGEFYVNFAWQARGNGFADTVTKEGQTKFEQRLGVARQALEEAWEVEPNNPRTAARMITVEKGLSRGRDEMEKWFQRAMSADGNNINACRAKLDWLDPKWNGSEEEMLAFGKACRETGNWRMGITLLAAEARHRAMARLSTDAAKSAYMRTAVVWDDFHSVYSEYVKHYPLDYAARSRYAAYCYLCGRYEESNRQFLVVGENLWWGEGFPENVMKRTRAYVARAVQQPDQLAK
jgi:hypothetical protein